MVLETELMLVREYCMRSGLEVRGVPMSLENEYMRYKLQTMGSSEIVITAYSINISARNWISTKPRSMTRRTAG